VLSLVFYLDHQWLFWVTFLSVVPGAFVEITPFFDVFLCLLVTLLFLWLGLVFKRLFIRVVFFILWLLRICTTELSFVSVLKFLLDFRNNIDKQHWVMRCPENPFQFGCICVEPHGISEPNVVLSLWYLAWCMLRKIYEMILLNHFQIFLGWRKIDGNLTLCL